MKQRTLQQNKALHKLFDLLAQAFNEAGYDVKPLPKEKFDIPWTGVLVKELIWRPIMQAMTEKFSTTELDRMEIDQIYEVINKNLGEKLGIHVPFPCDETDER